MVALKADHAVRSVYLRECVQVMCVYGRCVFVSVYVFMCGYIYASVCAYVCLCMHTLS